MSTFPRMLALGHVDREARQTTQDARTARTKNGKSLVSRWFPIGEAFEAAVVAWVALMERGGFGPEDALFPPLDVFHGFRKGGKYAGTPVPVMTSTHTITEAFRATCAVDTAAYTPHAAKHTIASERDRRSLTAEQGNAWSENMGHENEQTTDRHYGKLSEDRRLELLEDVGKGFEPLALEHVPVEKKIEIADDIISILGSSRTGS